MASNRHLGRIIALQTLFEQDFRRAAGDTEFDLEAVLERNIARYQATVDDKDFIERLVRGIAEIFAKRFPEPLKPKHRHSRGPCISFPVTQAGAIANYNNLFHFCQSADTLVHMST